MKRLFTKGVKGLQVSSSWSRGKISEGCCTCIDVADDFIAVMFFKGRIWLLYTIGLHHFNLNISPDDDFSKCMFLHESASAMLYHAPIKMPI